jgi:hypothetical protein
MKKQTDLYFFVQYANNKSSDYFLSFLLERSYPCDKNWKSDNAIKSKIEDSMKQNFCSRLQKLIAQCKNQTTDITSMLGRKGSTHNIWIQSNLIADYKLLNKETS